MHLQHKGKIIGKIKDTIAPENNKKCRIRTYSTLINFLEHRLCFLQSRMKDIYVSLIGIVLNYI